VGFGQKKRDESNSELSELTSGLFNGMEVIQMGGGIVVGSSIEDLGGVGATINSGMRLGRIIKYRDE
jgi:hypothetical protein